MGFRDTIINMLGGQVKTTNRARSSDFLRNGNRDKLYSDWSEIKIDDSDMYKGYTYAAIQKRGNKVATLAQNSLNTWVNERTNDAFQARKAEIVHPYLKLINESTDFTAKQFWKNISIYLDLAGRFYLGVVRTEFRNVDPRKPTFLTNARKFVLLNPYEIKRVVNKNGELAGYLETKPDGRQREWATYQIIEMKELNPFDQEKQWAMTDAAKDAVFTMEQSSDYTRQSLQGNLNAPGIISTDVILEDEEFANFRSRILSSAKGEPLFGNGSGAINWQSMQTDLDRAALLDINEINRNTLFAVSGTSKTVLGIEESGTTRETARVQSDNFISDTIEPRLEDIIGFLNMDYRRNYKSEYAKTEYEIILKDVLSKDYDSEIKAVQLRTEQMTLVSQLISAGYTKDSSIQFVYGEIGLEGLVEDENKEQNPGVFGEGGEGNDNPDQPINPETPEVEEAPEEQETESVNPVTTQTDKDIENMSAELFNLDVHKDLEQDNDICTCEHDDDIYYNALDDDKKKEFQEEYNRFLAEVKEVQKQAIKNCIEKVNNNSFSEADIINEEDKNSLIEKLKNFVKKYWMFLFPLYGNKLIDSRNEEYGYTVSLDFIPAIENNIDDNALKVANGHINTILKDILSASNRTYANILEKKAAEIIVQMAVNNPTKFEEWIKGVVTERKALRAIRNTDILEKNRKIYEKANKMALEGESRQEIIKAIRKEYNHISKERAELIVHNETSRAFTQSQYEADKHFLNSIGKMNQAYKELYSRTGHPCAACQKLIDKGPIPFNDNFLNKGDSIEFEENGKTKNFVANYEDISAGVVHTNCYPKGTSVYTNEGWKLFENLTGKELFWSINPETQKPEWVKAKKLIHGYSENLVNFKSKNINLSTTLDHNMYMMVPHRIGNNLLDKREYKYEFVEAQNVKSKYKFTSEVDWEGETPEFIELGGEKLTPKQYAQFMALYLSEGSCGFYNKQQYRISIAQETHHDKFWNILQGMPFHVTNLDKSFQITSKKLYEDLKKFGKSFEKYIPEELKNLAPKYLKEFLDCYVLGDGHKAISNYSNGVSRRIYTSSIRMRDDLCEVIAKAGFRPTFRKIANKGDLYSGTNYKLNNDIWSISICNKTKCGKFDKTIIPYEDEVNCVELEKFHTLFVEQNGFCWWCGNCQCQYRLVFIENNVDKTENDIQE